jgi:uncharacterized protein YndB with AHSA1/START domain
MIELFPNLGPWPYQSAKASRGSANPGDGRGPTRYPISMPQTTITDSITIAAAPDTVWHALVDPTQSRLWRGAEFVTDWRVGSPLSIERPFGRKTLRDPGTVLEAEAPVRLSYRFLPRISGFPDELDYYSTVTMLLAPDPAGTRVTVTHTVPPSPVRTIAVGPRDGSGAGERARRQTVEIGPESGEKHVAFYWRATLPLLRDLVEDRPSFMLGKALG